MSAQRIGGLETYCVGDSGAPIVLVAGPPVSAALFRDVQRRLAPRRSLAPELLSGGVRGVEALAQQLGDFVNEVGAAAVLAHGLAVPVAMRLDTDALVVLSNGPLTSLDPVTSALAALPRSALTVLLRPRLFRRCLASSIGLRRAVANPYVMDRDTVAMLSGPLLESSERRAATADWIRSLPAAVAGGTPGPLRAAAIWGDSDIIYPIKQVKSLVSARGHGALVAIPGGRMMHPEERPWALADALLDLLDPSLGQGA